MDVEAEPDAPALSGPDYSLSRAHGVSHVACGPLRRRRRVRPGRASNCFRHSGGVFMSSKLRLPGRGPARPRHGVPAGRVVSGVPAATMATGTTSPIEVATNDHDSPLS